MHSDIRTILTETTNLDKRKNGISQKSTGFYEHLNPKTANHLISLIIPVYHEEKILDSTLRIYTKELREKFRIELIVSDGGSSDATQQIAEKYADTLVVHKENRKQTIAEGRNKGAEVANGDILVFLNGDTIPDNIDNFFK